MDLSSVFVAGAVCEVSLADSSNVSGTAAAISARSEEASADAATAASLNVVSETSGDASIPFSSTFDSGLSASAEPAAIVCFSSDIEI